MKSSVESELESLQNEDKSAAERIEHLITNLNDIETRLDAEIKDVLELTKKFAKSDDMNESSKATGEKLASIEGKLDSELKSVNRKFGIFQKQEKYLLDMLTNVQTEVCGISDSMNSME